MAKAKASRKTGRGGKKGVKKVTARKKALGTKKQSKATNKKRQPAAKATRKPVAKKKPVAARPAVRATRLEPSQDQAPEKSMSKIGELCDAIFAFHTASKQPIGFQPGLSDQQIDDIMGDVELVLPQSARDLFKWGNGVDRTKTQRYEFMWMMCYFPLEENVAFYRSLCNVREDFSKEWFPLFQSQTADFFAIVCKKQFQPDGAIIHFDNYAVDHPVGFVSLERCLETMRSAFEKKIFRFETKNHFLEVESEGFGPFIASLNPETQDVWRELRG